MIECTHADQNPKTGLCWLCQKVQEQKDHEARIEASKHLLYACGHGNPPDVRLIVDPQKLCALCEWRAVLGHMDASDRAKGWPTLTGWDMVTRRDAELLYEAWRKRQMMGAMLDSAWEQMERWWVIPPEWLDEYNQLRAVLQEQTTAKFWLKRCPRAKLRLRAILDRIEAEGRLAQINQWDDS